MDVVGFLLSDARQHVWAVRSTVCYAPPRGRLSGSRQNGVAQEKHLETGESTPHGTGLACYSFSLLLPFS